MRRHLRLFLLLLLSIALPLNGMASMVMAAEPCPMQAQGPVMAGMQHSCCENHQKQLSVGKLCKGGQECKTNSAAQVAVIKPPIIAASRSPHSLIPDFAPRPAPFDVWRPPRS